MSQMKRISWTDEDGFNRAVLLPQSAPDEYVHLGIPSEPPNVALIDWVEIKRDLHNALMNENILTWRDVQNGQNRISAICRRVLIKRVINLYKQAEEIANE